MPPAAVPPAMVALGYHYFTDSVAEVAALMGVSAGTVKSRAHRARQLMRAALRQREPVREGRGR